MCQKFVYFCHHDCTSGKLTSVTINAFGTCSFQGLDFFPSVRNFPFPQPSCIYESPRLKMGFMKAVAFSVCWNIYLRIQWFCSEKMKQHSDKWHPFNTDMMLGQTVPKMGVKWLWGFIVRIKAWYSCSYYVDLRNVLWMNLLKYCEGLTVFSSTSAFREAKNRFSTLH